MATLPRTCRLEKLIKRSIGRLGVSGRRANGRSVRESRRWTESETDVAVDGQRTGQRLVEGERDYCVRRESERGRFVVAGDAVPSSRLLPFFTGKSELMTGPFPLYTTL